MSYPGESKTLSLSGDSIDVYAESVPSTPLDSLSFSVCIFLRSKFFYLNRSPNFSPKMLLVSPIAYCYKAAFLAAFLSINSYN
jgi:hypothetical protein